MQQIHDQIIMIFAAQLISDGIAQRVIRRLVVGVDHRLQLKIHLLQLVPGCMILHNDVALREGVS